MRIPAYHMRARRSAAAPTISIAGTMLIGETLTASATDTDTYQWYRAATLIGGATLSTYVVTDSDIGPPITCRATGPGGETASNALVYDDAGHLPATAIGVSTAGVTTADSGTTVDAWAATLGGIACTLTAPASTNRPAYSATGGVGSRPLVTFDGVDNVLAGTVTKGSAFDDYEIGFAGRRVALSEINDRLLGYYLGTSMRFGFIDRTATAIRWQVVGGVNQDFTADPDDADLYWSGDSAGGTQNARQSGTVVVTGAATTTSRGDGETFAIGAAPDGTLAANIRAQAWTIGPALTTTQRTHLRALLSYHTGIAC